MASEWFSTTVFEQIELQRGFDITKATQKIGVTPVISSSGISSFHDQAMVHGPGVVLGRKGVVGSVFYSEENFWPHDTTLWVKNFRGNLPEYVYYFFKSLAPQLAALDVGSANPTLNRNHVHPLRIIWPAIDGQTRIASVLRCMDQRIVGLYEEASTLEAIARAVFKSWFVDFDPVRAKAEGREPDGMDAATAAAFPDQLEPSELGLVPLGWQVRPVRSFGKVQKGLSYKGSGLAEQGTPMINLGCFASDGRFVAQKLKRYVGDFKGRHKVQAGEIVMANTDITQRRDVLAVACEVPPDCDGALFTHHVFCLRLEASTPQMNRFLLGSLQQKAFRERATGFASGTTVLALPPQAVDDYRLVYPGDALTARFHETVSAISARCHVNTKTTATLTELRDTLLPRLISGKLRIPDAEKLVASAL